MYSKEEMLLFCIVIPRGSGSYSPRNLFEILDSRKRHVAPYIYYKDTIVASFVVLAIN